MHAEVHMAPTTLAQDSTVYTFSVRQRAGLQVLGDALQYLAGAQQDDRDAALILWAARERILKAAARRRMPTVRRLLAVVWRNQNAGAR